MESAVGVATAALVGGNSKVVDAEISNKIVDSLAPEESSTISHVNPSPSASNKVIHNFPKRDDEMSTRDLFFKIHYSRVSNFLTVIQRWIGQEIQVDVATVGPVLSNFDSNIRSVPPVSQMVPIETTNIVSPLAMSGEDETRRDDLISPREPSNSTFSIGKKSYFYFHKKRV